MNPVDDFLKEASKGSFFRGLAEAFGRGASGGASVGKNLPLGEVVGKSVAGGMGRVATGMAGLSLLAAGGHGASRAYDAISERLTKTRDYKGMLEANPSLGKYDAGQVQMVFNSLRNQAPSLSKDPLIAGSFVRRTLEVSPESGPFIDTQTAKTLSDTHKNIVQARSTRGPISESFKPMIRMSTDAGTPVL